MRITNRKAAELQHSLSTLSGMSLPVKISLRLARLAEEVEKQVKTCIKVRDVLLKTYKVTISQGKKDDQIELTTSITGADSEETQKLKEEALIAFTEKVKELLEEEGEDITITIPALPDSLVINPAALKTLLPFMEEVNA